MVKMYPNFPWRGDAISGLIVLGGLGLLVLLGYIVVLAEEKAVKGQLKFNLGMFLGLILLAIGAFWMYMRYIHPIFTGEWWK